MLFGKNEGILHIFLIVIAAVLFLMGASPWPLAADNPGRVRLVSAGLFFLTCATVL